MTRAAEKLSSAVGLYAQSHGLTVEQAREKIAATAANLAEAWPIVLPKQEMAAVEVIRRCEREGIEWDASTLQRELRFKHRQQAFALIARLNARGALRHGTRTVKVATLVLADAKFALKGSS